MFIDHDAFNARHFRKVLQLFSRDRKREACVMRSAG